MDHVALVGTELQRRGAYLELNRIGVGLDVRYDLVAFFHELHLLRGRVEAYVRM